jgi:hypothetical protein
VIKRALSIHPDPVLKATTCNAIWHYWYADLNVIALDDSENSVIDLMR